MKKCPLKILQDLHKLTSSHGQLAQTVTTIVSEAKLCISRPHSNNTQDSWLAIRQLVGGTLPRWEGTPPDNLDTQVTQLLRLLQSHFTQRLHDWSKHMAPAGQRRQRSWDHESWLMLVLKAWQHATKRSATLIGHFKESRLDLTHAKTFTEYRTDTKHQNKILHLHTCARAYLVLVHAPQEWERRRHARRLAHKRAMKGKLKFWMRYTHRELKTPTGN